MISVHKLTRKYGDFSAVDQVSFDINPGEIVGLLGHNGAGKTTIMKMITGYLEPTSGTITIDGKGISGRSQSAQQNIGYLPENCPVYPEMTVIDYLDYAAALHGLSVSEREPLIAEAIYRTELTDKATHLISTLSRGYRQRTGVAQAILHQPKILILDEPTNGLDPTQIQHMRDLITTLAKEATVIISTHILREVQAICDRVIILKDGSKALDTPLKSLHSNNRLMIRVNADAEQANEMLQSIPGCEAVEDVTSSHDQRSGFCYGLSLIDIDDGHDQIAAAVAAAIHKQGWQLYAMDFESKDLERVFAEISA